MRSTDILRREHDIILDGLELLADSAARLAEGADLSTAALGGLVDFFRRFADHAHHAKEERALFPALHDAGLPRDAGPVAVMLYEHEQGRTLLAALGESAGALPDPEARLRFAEAAQRYVNLLAGHIRKENEVLFRMAERVIDPVTDEALVTAFARAQAEHVAADEYASLAGRVAELSTALRGQA